jgi:hypothetical protein
MNRRDFGKTALAVAASAMVAPAALASTPRSITDSVVIDYEGKGLRWVYLDAPDETGHRFAYEDTGETVRYRHFEFLRDDGLVVGESTKMSRWAESYDSFEREFLQMSKPPGSKRFSGEEFSRYVEEVRYYYDGRIVPVEDLASTGEDS